MRTGRSRTLTFPNRARIAASVGVSTPDRDNTVIGKSDHIGCNRTHSVNSSGSAISDSSETTTAPAPSPMAAHTSRIVRKTSQPIRSAASNLRIAAASRLVGGSRSTRVSSSVRATGSSMAIARLLQQFLRFADVGRNPRQHALEIHQRRANVNSLFVHLQFTNRQLVL